MVTELNKLETRSETPEVARDEVIQVYEAVCEGRRRRFPNNFFHGRIGKERAAVITRYLLEDKLGIRVEDMVMVTKKGSLLLTNWAKDIEDIVITE